MNELKKHYTPEELEAFLSFIVDYSSEKQITKDEQITLRQLENDISTILIGF